MRSITKRFQYNGDTPPINIGGFGDWHVGNVCASWKGLRRVVKFIHDTPDMYWIGMGDFFDGVTVKDPRHKPGVVDKDLQGKDDFIDLQYQKGVDLVRPIADKCLAVVIGNHEETLETHCNTNLAKRMAAELGVPFLGYEGYITLRFTHKSGGKGKAVRVFVTHGHGGGRKPGGKINRLDDIRSSYPADFYFMGHTHDMMERVVPIMEPSKSGVRNKHSVGQVTSAFLMKHTSPEDNVTTYVEKAGYQPTAIGWNYCSYDPSTGRKSWAGWVYDD